MVEKPRYPQIPSTVWWGVRAILQKTPNATVDERLLGIQLQVQQAAARQYITELRAAGILNEECKATPLALKWRLDEKYLEAVEELLGLIYPEGLRHVAPPGEADRQKVVSWFLHEGLGQGAAGNKAATYLLISSPVPNEAPNRTNGGRGLKEEAAKRSTTATKSSAVTGNQGAPRKSPERTVSSANGGKKSVAGDSIPLNVNVQIHISADAGSEQIESIFSAMKRYLYDAQGH
ncbi:hypothetical protein [Nitratireductor sp. GCM10026969]|uniref:hypothetical protein n=1 Tax=Nitratireductor sp. GCM10026969 TaxID=3252645 RepID=UPI0036091265